MANNSGLRYVEAIKKSKFSIYDRLEIGDPNLWIPTYELECLLNQGLIGTSLAGLPLRTRSKVVKECVCKSLGYPVPPSFKKTQPRFPGQFFDIYVQKANNLQVWNEELSSERRYVIIRVDSNDSITKVKVVTGNTLAAFDTTGTLTQKYQARLIPSEVTVEIIVEEDTDRLRPLVRKGLNLKLAVSPIDNPHEEQILSIWEIFDRLKPLVGTKFLDRGYDQERNRGAELHRLVCEYLGYADYRDGGQFPDVLHQLLEVKLQTSPTIDLGLVCPDSTDALDIPSVGGACVRHCDVRYALFYAKREGDHVLLTHFFLTTGEKFFTRFPQFQGKILNKKLQIPLPDSFFND